MCSDGWREGSFSFLAFKARAGRVPGGAARGDKVRPRGCGEGGEALSGDSIGGASAQVDAVPGIPVLRGGAWVTLSRLLCSDMVSGDEADESQSAADCQRDFHARTEAATR